MRSIISDTVDQIKKIKELFYPHLNVDRVRACQIGQATLCCKDIAILLKVLLKFKTNFGR